MFAEKVWINRAEYLGVGMAGLNGGGGGGGTIIIIKKNKKTKTDRSMLESGTGRDYGA